MSEYLIYNRGYETTYQKGDIVEIRSDGYWENRGFNTNVFKVLSIPDDSLVADISPFFETPTQLLKKRTYNIDITSLNFINGKYEEKDKTKINLFKKEVKEYLGIYKYVRSGATGLGTGEDWTNAYTTLPDNLIRGVIYYIATGAYGPKVFNDTENGTEEIIIKKATVSDHGPATDYKTDYLQGQAIFQQLDSCSTGTAIFEFNEGYYVIDGSFWLGFKFYTNTSDIDSLFLVVDTTYLGRVFENLFIMNSEVEHKGCDNTDGGGRGFQVHSQAKTNNCLIKECYFHDIPGIPIYFYNSSNGIVENCYVARNHNDAVYHGEGIQTGGHCPDFIIRNNIWEDIEGTAFIVAGSGWKVYNNIFFYSATYPNTGQSGSGIGMGIVTINGGEISGDCRVCHNTAYNLQGTNAGFNGNGFENNLVYNNIWANCARVRWINGIIDYNYFLNNIDIASGDGSNNQIDTIDIFEDAISNNFKLIRNTLNGVILTQDINCNYETDIVGVDRTTNDRGAYQFAEEVILVTN